MHYSLTWFFLCLGYCGVWKSCNGLGRFLFNLLGVIIFMVFTHGQAFSAELNTKHLYTDQNVEISLNSPDRGQLDACFDHQRFKRH